MSSNFSFLAKYWEDLALLGACAESYLYTDPNVCIYKLGLFAERLVGELCRFEDISFPEGTKQVDKIRYLSRAGLLPGNICDILTALRKARNDAVHAGLNKKDRAAILLRMAFSLSIWFMGVYGDWAFHPKPYCEPEQCPTLSSNEERIREQEEKLKLLEEQLAEIQTAVSNLPRETLREQAELMSEKLPLSPLEADYLAAEQLHMELSILPSINFALQQNHIPVIQSITISNPSGRNLEAVDLQIVSNIEAFLPYSKHLEEIPANESFVINPINLMLDAQCLAGLTEKLSGLVKVSLTSEGTLLCEETAELTVLAFDEWPGYTLYPEILAAFVTPNHPEIVKINARSAQFLEKWTGDPSFDAYQSRDPNRVLFQAAAVYGALQEQNIIYSVPPASFQRYGQRVRLCDTVLYQKMGTCLDLTLLYAACLESIGLHPLLILQEGHIFAGLWLEEMTFPEVVQDDASLLTKRLADGINELVVVECTAFVAEKNMSFDDACRAAQQNLVGDDSIQCVIDVTRSRFSGISPLPLRIQSESGWRIVREQVEEFQLTGAPKEMSDRIEVREGGRNVPTTKKQIWERKLLDLGLRNTLINMQLSRTAPLLIPSIHGVESALANDGDFSILPRPMDWHIPKESISFEMMHELGEMGTLVKSEFQNRRLRSILTEGDLAHKIKELYRSSKAAIEESGANALYLALGILRWYETSRSTKPRYAPLILLPVQLVRRGANQGYVIRLRDDDPQMNITLLEKLNQDFGIKISGLDPLPQGEHGVDTRQVLTVMRKSVMEQQRWDVLESAYLGIFSFSQFMMWSDIRSRSDELVKNKIVRSLMEGRLCWEAQPMTLGEMVPEDEVFLPLSADASQLYAIRAAGNGESFVLHGPPGTGKSQTITALIANSLAQGQSVLFVAEKMAALEVVQKRLAAIGIGPFCLELHSNKSKKKDVLDQLRQVMEVTKGQTCRQYQQRADQIASLRKELGGYVHALHKAQPCGSTLFELVDQYEKNCHAPDLSPFSDEILEHAEPAELDQWITMVERLIAAAKEVGHPGGHPLQRVGCRQYSQKLRTEIPENVCAYQNALEDLKSQIEWCAQTLVQPIPETRIQLQDLAELAQAVLPWVELPIPWAEEEDISQYLSGVEEMAEQFLMVQNLHHQLSENWNSEFFLMDGKALREEYNLLNSKWLVQKLLGLNGMVKRMTDYHIGPLTKEQLPDAFIQLENYQCEQKKANDLLQDYGNGLDVFRSGTDTDWHRVLETGRWAKRSAWELEELTGNHQIRMHCGGKRTLKEPLTAFINACQIVFSKKEHLYRILFLKDSENVPWIEEEQALCQGLMDYLGELKEWITWNQTAAEAKELGLDSVVEAYYTGMPHDLLKGAYLKAMAKGLAMRAIDTDEVLGTFSGAVFNEKIAQFKRIDSELTDLTRQEIFCRLAANVPDCISQAAQSSEVGILQRAIRSNGRGISIRRLFEQIPNLLPKLCPCMLMSPLSAAQYLDPKREPFDLVVFDEASQLPTSKAVGALARGRNAVIVGDPKQMPPTSFFKANTVDEDNPEAEDLESILDDCLALNMPQTHLLWHYRSRHESLIAFSNRQFYENELYTFPSVDDRASRVSLVPVKGIFGRGKTRQNQAEAEAVVAELKRRCNDPELSKYSVGVLTFSINQQNLIDDLLTEACGSDPTLDQWVLESEEPVFIKNLENVQGDERDVILFSVGYGADQRGKFSANFGPLNRSGGWRRLNVAVSRARHEMKVFSSLTPLDLARSSSEGVSALKAFLEYAQSGQLAMDEKSIHQMHNRKTGIPASICAALQDKGYRTQCAVGKSEYRVDVGIIDPKRPDRYLLGILLDGESYGKAKTVRDREVAQIDVLRDLGWNIMRIWTMDWWDNRGKELERVFARLEELKKQPPNPAVLPAKRASYPPPDVERKVARAVKGAKAVPPPVSLTPPSGISLYEPALLKEETLTSEDFLQPIHTNQIQKKILCVIEKEAPVCEALLMRRVVQSFGIMRMGSRIQARMTQILSGMSLNCTRADDQLVFWKAAPDPNNYTGVRANGTGEARRDIQDVPIREAENAIVHVLEEQAGLPEDNLIREAAKLMGYSRLGNTVRGIFYKALVSAGQQDRIECASNGNWILKQSNRP